MSLIQAALDKNKPPQTPRPQTQPMLKNKLRPVAPERKPEPEAKNQAAESPFQGTARPVSKRKSYFPFVLILLTIPTLIGMFFYFGFLQKSAGDPPDSPYTEAYSHAPVSPAAPIVEASQKMFPMPGSRMEYMLNGITTSDGERIALVNNEIVRPGDVVGDHAVVKEILSRSVVLDVKGKEQRLTI